MAFVFVSALFHVEANSWERYRAGTRFEENEVSIFIALSADHLVLVAEALDERRAFGAGDVSALLGFASRYRALVSSGDGGELLALGRDLYD